MDTHIWCGAFTVGCGVWGCLCLVASLEWVIGFPASPKFLCSCVSNTKHCTVDTHLSWLGSFNKYVQLTGCTKYKRPATVGDDTPLLHLLSYSVDGEQGSDLLYTVIMDIVRHACHWNVTCEYVCHFVITGIVRHACHGHVTCHMHVTCEHVLVTLPISQSCLFFLQIKFLNKFVRSLMETLESTELGRCYFPNTIPKVHVMEYAQHYMLTLTPHRCVYMSHACHMHVTCMSHACHMHVNNVYFMCVHMCMYVCMYVRMYIRMC